MADKERLLIRDMSKLRVAIFSDAMADRNGVGAYYRDLADHLEERLSKTILIGPLGKDPEPYCMALFPLPGDPTQRLFLPRAAAIVQEMKHIAPQIVVSATPGPFGLLAVALARMTGACLFVGYHTRYDELLRLYWPSGLPRFSAPILKNWDRLFFRSGKAVVANSRQMSDNARRLGVREIHRVGTPVAPHLLRSPLTPLSGKIRSVLFAGRLAAEKNIYGVIRSAACQPHRRFVVAGDGPLKQAVVRASQELANLEYRGWVDRWQILDLMDRCDLLVLPSKEEAFGTIALEGMARRCMVLVSSRCGILNWPELSAGLFQIRNDETLAEAIERIDGLGRAVKMKRALVARRAAEDFSGAALEDWLGMFGRFLDPDPCPKKKTGLR